MAGFEIVEIPSLADGRIDLDALAAVADETTAAMMITNPNTLGLFEADIKAASDIVHNAGGQMYYDGANFNAILGIIAGLMGFDAVHFNLHKTFFSQPHGGGGRAPVQSVSRHNLPRFCRDHSLKRATEEKGHSGR